MAVPNIGEIASTTLRNRSGELADNVSKNTALLMRLRERGRSRPVDGGDDILQELTFAENSTYKRYSGYELLDISPSEVISAARFPWKQTAVAVTISGIERLRNSGREREIDLLEGRIENAEMTMANGLSTDIYSDGLADGGKQINGLQQLVADSPGTGTVGGINRANWEFWRNQTQTAGITSSNVLAQMQSAWVKQVRNRDRPDLIVADNNMYQLYWGALTDLQRFTDRRMAGAGFQNLLFVDAPVVLDGGMGGGAPTKKMYFLNTRYLFWRPHRDRNMVPLEADRFAVNQDAMVRLIAWAGNMTMSNASLQGVLIDNN